MEQEQINSDQEKSESEMLDERQPQFGQFEGQKVYLAGLDYSLLKEQKLSQKKKGFMDQLKLQLSDLQKKIDSKNVKTQKGQIELDQNSLNLISTIKQLKHKTMKPLINKSTYYIFDTKFNFGAISPQIISKRMGRINNQPIYIKKNNQAIRKFSQIVEATERQKLVSQKANANNQQKKANAIKKLMKNEDQSEDSDSDDIFGNDSENCQKQKEETTKAKQKKKLFNFGKGLNFGINDEEIFKKSQQKQKDQLKQYQEKFQQSGQRQVDKYDFLRKKVKKTNEGDYDDGYGECYIQTGPSLEQMKEYRKLGIQLFGDAKQFKFKQKKVNINKDYEKIKKIIQEKGKN